MIAIGWHRVGVSCCDISPFVVVLCAMCTRLKARVFWWVCIVRWIMFIFDTWKKVCFITLLDQTKNTMIDQSLYIHSFFNYLRSNFVVLASFWVARFKLNLYLPCLSVNTNLFGADLSSNDRATIHLGPPSKFKTDFLWCIEFSLLSGWWYFLWN